VRVLRQGSKVMGIALACALTGPLSASSAPAGSAASSNVLVQIAVGGDLRAPVIPRGGTATVGSLGFKAGANVETIGPDSTDNVRIHFELPAGLHWGTDLPDPTENCSSTASAAECRPGFILDPQNPGTRAAGWIWDVVADAPGSYQLKAEVLSSSADDPDLSDNSAIVTVVVTRAITASTAGISPARPRAGAVVVARVFVRAGDEPITPTRVACSGSASGRKVAGAATAMAGSAKCTFLTPRAARGKTLRGTVAFTAGDTRLNRRFAVKLR
jgi:hypothetical protein